MEIKRRDFLRYCITSAAALGLPLGVVGKLQKAYAAGSDLPNVIWLNGANCSGCTVSLANLIGDSNPKEIGDLLLNNISLAFHSTLMGAAGDDAVDSLKNAATGNFILAVEGGIPTAFGGHTCMLWEEGGNDITARDAVLTLAPQAQAILSIGTCAAYGGIPAGNPNPTAIQSVGELTGLAHINIPGCPPHPDWIVYVIAHLLAGEAPQLDANNRPVALFPRGEDGTIHEHCPREDEDEASRFGLDGRCLQELGCNGKHAHADCHARKWNNGTQWCIGANAVCIACTEPGFPDQFTPFFKVNFSDSSSDNPPAEDPPSDPPNDPPGSSGTLSIRRAEWRRNTLLTEGKADSGRAVAVHNADTGSLLGITNADSDGSWDLKIRRPSPIPTRVRALSGGLAVERAVQNAPRTTGSSTRDGERDD